MASSLATASPASSISVVNKPTTNSRHRPSKLYFPLSSAPKLQFLAKGLQPTRNRSTVVNAQLKEVAAEETSNASAASSSKSEVPAVEAKVDEPSKEKPLASMASEESISEFIAQVASLVKLVDSRDIVELHMKQLDCELTIRKKEALPQPQSPAPYAMMQSHYTPALMQPAPSAPTPAPAPAPASSPASTPALPPPSKPSPLLPTVLSPMAGTFYRSGAPGEPPFVKVGDKIQKGQVLCIIEAMKLMNEIESDKSGTLVDILMDDAKPVSVDTPLFVVEP